MAFPKSVKELCTPAFIYFTLSMIGIFISVIQNFGNRRVYSMGLMHARVPNTTVVFIVKFVYILFWTYVLNLICRDGHKEISWFLILVPFILLFMVVGMTGTMTESFAPIVEKFAVSGNRR